MRDGSEERGTMCGTSLVFVGQIQHRVVINNEHPRRVSLDLGISQRSIRSIARMLREFGSVPSKERLAVIAMRVPDATDADIAEWFGKDIEWAAIVRRNQDAIREREYIKPQFELIDDEMDCGMPSVEERARIAAELRAQGNVLNRDREAPRVEIASYQWNGSQHAFFPVGT